MALAEARKSICPQINLLGKGRVNSGPSSRISSGHRAPLLNGAGDNISQRTLTPTKQVSLVAVKRKNGGCTKMYSDGPPDKEMSSIMHTILSTSSMPTSSIKATTNHVTSTESIHKKNSKSKLTSSGQDEDEEDDSSDEDEEEEIRKAPDELLIEFVTALMTGDYVSAKKLCELILIYEPGNKEALQFQPLINEKIQLEEERESEESDESDDSDSDDDDSDDSSDSSDSSTSNQDTDKESTKSKQTGSEKTHCCKGAT